MESRLLDACREALASQIAPRAQIVAAARLAADRCDLLLEGVARRGHRTRLVVDLAPSRASLYLALPGADLPLDDRFHRLLEGRWIAGIDRPRDAPLLRLLLTPPGEEDSDQWLVFEWLGGRPDAVLVEAASLRVLEALRGGEGSHAARRAPGSAYRWPAPPRRPVYSEATPRMIETIFSSDRVRPPFRALSRGLAGLPLFLAYEAIARGGNDPATVAGALRAIGSAPLDPTLYTVRDPDIDLPASFVSPIPLPSLERHCRAQGEPLFHLMKRAHEAVLRAERDAEIHDAFLRLIETEERRLIRLHGRLAAESREAATAKSLRRRGEALLIHVKEIPRGAERFLVPDPGDPGSDLEIDLDPSLSVPANADLLFRRARRLARGEPIRLRRIEALERAIANLSSLRQRSRGAGTKLSEKGGALLREALGRFVRNPVVEEWERRLTARAEPTPTRSGRSPESRRTRPPGRRGEERFHPRAYETQEGWKVLVGRSNAENDHVTHTLASPDDYWFHVHGCPGSHVVLRREGRRDNPSARTIEEAAAIAAYFSRARTSRKAPVVYTLKKYVRRPRKGPPGLALVTREKTIMVEPKAPETADPGDWGNEEESE